MIPLTVSIIGAICKFIGERSWHNAQRFILPVVYSAAVSFDSHLWWLGLTTLPMIAFIVEPYDLYGPIDAFDRGMWLFLITGAAGFGPFVTQHLAWNVFIPIWVLSGVWGATTRKLDNRFIAPVSGLIIVAFIWWIK